MRKYRYDSENLPVLTNRPEIDESGRSIERRLGELTLEERALAQERLDSIDPHPARPGDYLGIKLTVIAETLKDIEEARQAKGENDE